MHPKELHISDYTYNLPEDRIARYPLADRSASRLLIYRDGTISEDIYRNIASHLPVNTVLVFNQTKVVHARLLFKKPSGGVIEVFCLAPHKEYADIQTAMLQKGKVFWECLIGGAGKWKHGMVLQLTNESAQFTLSAKIVERDPAAYILSLEWDNEELTFAEVLHHAGKVPLPPYLHREAEKTDETSYQTIFATVEGSVAAPTAGLHFTHEIFDSFSSKNIRNIFLTLHVGAGTFKPVKAANMGDHDMHAEWIEITVDALKELVSNLDKDIVAVGTTSLRTLESLYWLGNKLKNNIEVDLHGIAVKQWEPYDGSPVCSSLESLTVLLRFMDQNQLNKLITRTQILIAPGYTFRVVSGLVTNFHQPQSTLLLLVAALIGEDWEKIYDYALNHQYRFLSYGDGSLLWKNQPA